MSDLITQLKQGLQAMNIVLPDETCPKLIQFVELIARWNKTYNLTAVRNPADMISKHLLDSLAVLPLIAQGKVLDVGSGAGLPGIPLALALPANHFVLIDKNGKKCRFMTQAKIELELDNIEVINSRIEDYQPGIYFEHVIARAYASTAEILKSTQHVHNLNTRILIMQGKLDERVQYENYILKQSHRLDVPGLNAERHVLEIVKQQ